jgi:hypothetical protein
MRLLLLILAGIGALLAAGLFLLPLLLAHAPALVGALGVLLLLAALLWPRRQCTGVQIHCTGCKHHH